MGLRERNAAHTRELILDTALPLFLEQGYEATTMEEIAERAGIGTSTLYRYFPSKDLLVLEPLSVRGHLAAELRARPVEEPLDLALGHALTAFLTAARGDAARLRQVGAVVDSTPGLRARLLEEFIKERTLLEQAVADRLGRPTDDLFVVMTARTTTTVLELIAGLGEEDLSEDPATREREILALARRVTDQLHLEPPIVPRVIR